MDIKEFVDRSIGQWKSQRSAHHMAFSHFEAVQSIIDITRLASDDPAVIELCQTYQVDPDLAVSPFQMKWEGESDWDEDNPEVKGCAILIPVPDPIDTNRGKLLRDKGYAETIAAAAEYHFLDDGTFVLITAYDRAAAEERIWFANPKLRFRVSLIKTSAGSGVVTASFSSEIRTT